MIWLQLFIHALVICSKLIEAEVPLNSSVVETKGSDVAGHDSVYGAADVRMSSSQKFLCNGVHLKPWIVLTFGDCVYNFTSQELSVRVKKLAGNDVNVAVKSVDFHPEYINLEPENNLAFLYIYANMDWQVGNYYLPDHKYTAHEIISLKLNASIVEWINPSKWEVVSTKVNVTEDHSQCGALDNFDDYYYCLTKGKGDFHHKDNVGMPFYIQKSINKKTKKVINLFLGLYTGILLADNAPGFLFQMTFPCQTWMEEYIWEHPVPPEARHSDGTTDD